MNKNLSFRERQVVSLVALAKLNKEIAHDLHLTEGTIKEYLNRIFRKLSLTNRTELAVWELTRRENENRARQSTEPAASAPISRFARAPAPCHSAAPD